MTTCTILGEKVELHLQCAGQALLAVRPGGSDAALPDGQAVGVAVDPSALMLLPPEPAA